MISIRPKKRIVYIDQSIFSNFSKADKKNLENYKKLFDVLHEAVSMEKVICPQSWFHREETSLIKKEVEKILKHQFGYLSQVDFELETTIERQQFKDSANQFLKNDINFSQITFYNFPNSFCQL